MANRDILAVGTSAGGFDALRRLARDLPDDLPASVLVVIHLPARFASALDAILSEAGRLPASFARDGDLMRRGHIYIAPPTCHLLVDGKHLRLGSGPRENNARPAIDPLFRSVALCCGPRSVGVVMTGTLGDGASGLHALKQCGGITVVQDPADAAFPDRPVAALRRSEPDYVVRLTEMAALLHTLVQEPAGAPVAPPRELKDEVEIARHGYFDMNHMDRIGRRSVLSCPECHGALWEVEEGGLVRYRCHVGHAYTSELMSVALDDGLRRAIASALRVLDERIALARRLIEEDSRNGQQALVASWTRKLRQAEEQAGSLRAAIKRVDEIAAQAEQQAPSRSQRQAG